MENENKTNQNRNVIIIIAIIAVLAIIGVVIFLVTGNQGGTASQTPVISQTVELNSPNLSGKWYAVSNGVTSELRFMSDYKLSYTQSDASGNVTAKSDSGTYELDKANGKITLTITAGGQSFSDICTVILSETQLSVTADEGGSGIFNGFYEKKDESGMFTSSASDSNVTEPAQTDASSVPENTESASQTMSESTTAATTESTTVQTTTESTTIQTTKATTVQTPAPVPQGNGITINDNVKKYLTMTCEQVYNNNVPASMDEKAGFYGIAVYYVDGMKLSYTYNGGKGTGYPVEIYCAINYAFPEISQGLNKYEIKNLLSTKYPNNFYMCHDYTGTEYIMITKDGFTFSATQGVDGFVNNVTARKNPTEASTSDGMERTYILPDETCEMIGMAYLVNANGGLNMRTGPSTSALKTMQIPDQSEVTVICKKDGWAYVEYRTGGIYESGWVSADYIAPCMM